MKLILKIVGLAELASCSNYVYWVTSTVYNQDYKLKDYLYVSTDGYHSIYNNPGEGSTFGKVY